jgi:hypothetical protein
MDRCQFARLLSIVVACAAMTCLRPVNAQQFSAQAVSTFGKTAIGATPSAGLSADFKRASRFTLSEPGTVSELCAYLDGKGGGTGVQYAQFALYADANGVPGTKVFETHNWGLYNGAPAQWVCRSGDHLAPIPAGRYWIAIFTSVTYDPGPSPVIRDYYDGPANWYGAGGDSFDDGPSNTFGTGSAGSGTLTAFVRYYRASELGVAGRTTVGTTPSSGMTANYKRGSSFTLPARGKLRAINAYLDGQGTTNFDDQAAFRYVIYKDAGGVPGAKVFESFTDLYMRGTWQPRWVTDWALYGEQAPTLDAGRYWLVLHTSGISDFNGALTDTGGFIRNYGDGTGNWYGNADRYLDRASDPFGPGKTGNGTISAYVLYRPGAVTTGEFGNHESITTLPSKALDADKIRWSGFILNDPYTATLTGLHAYLDGLGRTSGSQPVRLVLYGFHFLGPQSETQEWHKYAQSDVVTISAGMQPRWVGFRVPAGVTLDADFGMYRIGIQTGAGAVARDYGENRSDLSPNWQSKADAFADGAVELYPDPDPTVKNGTGTLSVYATYSLPP